MFGNVVAVAYVDVVYIDADAAYVVTTAYADTVYVTTAVYADSATYATYDTAAAVTAGYATACCCLC